MSAGVWIRKPQPPLERGSWLPKEAIEHPLETFRRLARERAEQAAAQAYWDDQWRRDMADIETERRYANRSKRQAKPRDEPSFHKSAYTRATDAFTRDAERERFRHEESTARIVGKACARWMLNNGMRLDAYRWKRTSDGPNSQMDTP